ncbi:MAG: T9SS type A sorting domain-containing protein [Caldithrix sp.]|nr:T9SS type A sorting domain-containing protein [Caldithrix sp.]
MMKNKFLYAGLSLIFVISTQSGNAYQWPLKPFDQQHEISGTFCENRPSGSVLRHHFHNAIDIPLSEDGKVYAIVAGYVTGIVRKGYSAYIRVGRYNYLHVNPLVSLDVNDYVEKDQLVGYTNYANHIHLIDGEYPNYINPIREGGIAPFEDPFLPTVQYIKFFQDRSTFEFDEGKVTGKVDIVARLYDRTDNGALGSNNGIYRAGFQIYDSSGTQAVTNAVVPYQFDARPSNSYIKNVYFKGSDLSTYIYTLTNKVNYNSYWNTDDFEKGTYRIKVFTEDTRGNRSEKWTTVEIVEPDDQAPAKPVIKSFTGRSDGGWDMAWKTNPANDVDGYHFLFSFDGHRFDTQEEISDALAGSDTSYTYADFGYTYPLFVRLQAYDHAAIANRSTPSNTYAVKLSENGARILIVDGFSRTDGYWTQNRHDFVSDYARHLIEQEESFNSCSVNGLLAGTTDMTDYKIVIYFTGDRQGLSIEEQDLIRAYLEGGGQLFISGSGLISGLTNDGYGNFSKEYLRAQLKSDSTSHTGVSDPDGINFATITPPENQLPASDVLISGDAAQTFFIYADGQTAVSAYSGTFGSSDRNGSVVTAAFPFELLQNDDARQMLFNQVLDFMDEATPIAETQPSRPNRAVLLDNYPNPFNPQTTIRYGINKKQHVQLTIYNVLGEKISTLLSREVNAGMHTFRWNGRDDHDRAVSSGIYLCRLQTEDHAKTIKLFLMR